mgnify:CR=1 FL=1
MGLVLFFQVTGTIAQSYKPGYIITKEGEKISGFVKISTMTRSAIGCSFASDIRGKGKKSYQPEDLKGYGYNEEESYETKNVKFYDLVEQTEIEKTLFLEVLIKGKVSLYHFKDSQPLSRRESWRSANHYYIQKNDKSISELTIRGRETIKNSRKYVHITKLYIGTLNYTLTECTAIKKMINRTKLSRKSLKKIIYAYNNCGIAQLPRSHKKNEEGKVGKRYFSLGLSMYNFNRNVRFFGIPEMFLNGGKANSNGWGVFTLFSLDKNNHVFGAIEFNFLNYEYNIDSKANSSLQNYYWNAKVMQIPILVRYAIPSARIKPFLGAGVSFNFALNQSENLGNRPRPVIGFLDQFKSFGLGWLVEGGAKVKIVSRLDASLSARWGNNREFLISASSNATAKTWSFRLGLGYVF